MTKDNTHNPRDRMKQDSSTAPNASIQNVAPSSIKRSSVVEESPLLPLTPQEKVIRLLPFFALGLLAMLWATLDVIPIEVVGRSVLITPRSILGIQSRSAGKIRKIYVQPGDTVKAGQLLMTIDLPEVQEQLLTQQQKLAQLQKENQSVTKIEGQRTQLKRETLERQKASDQQEITSLRSQYEANLRQIEAHQIKLDANARQRIAYQQRIEQLKDVNQLIRKRLNAFDQLINEGAIATLSPDLVQIIQTEQNNQNTITTLSASLDDNQASNEQIQAEIKQLNAENKGLLSEIENQQANLNNINTQNQQQDLDNLESNLTRLNEITNQQEAIANTKRKLATESRIVSAYEGRILDLAVNSSQYIETGTRIGTIQTTSTDDQPISLSFFQVGDAERIQPKMRMEITPDIEQRERYGGIVATVLTVSQEAITPQEVASLVGSEKIAEALTNGQPVFQITAELKRNAQTISGYQWTQGNGAPQKIPNSTTATARVEVERRSLISYLLPVLRRITGIYS